MDKKEFVKDLYLLAELCGYKLKDDIAVLYVKIIEPYGWSRVKKVVERFLLEARPFKFPVPADFLQALGENLDSRDEAQNIVSKIFSAIGKIGTYQPDRAKEFIGDIGWLAIEGFGGWSDICSICNEDNVGTLRAQMRDSIVSIINRRVLGKSDAPLTFADIESRVKLLTAGIHED